MYSVIVLTRAQKQTKALDRSVKNKVVDALVALAADPRPPGCIKIKSEDGVWRIRVNDYRIGYSIDDASQLVTVLRVGHRSEFYS